MASVINKSWSFLWGLLICCSGQLSGNPGSEPVLDYATFMEMVRTYHPVAVQAELRQQDGSAKLLAARGGFDPVLFSDISQKYFDDNQYYSVIQSGIEIPTWLGVKVFGGFEMNRGDYLNPEHTVPDDGLWSAGISVPLGRGLLMDKRRAELRKAELYVQSAENERQAMINELLYQAGLAYIEWYRTYRAVSVLEEALRAGQSRLSMIRAWALAGDRAPIDTTEALIQVQNMALALSEAQLAFTQASADLNVYLWGENGTPLELSSTMMPDMRSPDLHVQIGALSLAEIEERIQFHPEVRNIQVQMHQLEIDRRLIRESLKPTLDVKYHVLNRNGQSNFLEQLSIQNYTWGLQFSMPLFLRHERGKARAIDLQIQHTALDYASVSQTFQNQVVKSFNAWKTSLEQLDIYTDVVRNYQQLLDSETALLEAGESSLFLVNARTTALIQAQLKMIDLSAKSLSAYLKTEYCLATLN